MSAWNRYIMQRGRRYSSCSFQNYVAENEDQRRAMDRLIEVANGEQLRNVILLGKAGTGKDHLLSAAVRLAISNKPYDTAWTSGPRLFSDLRTAMSTRDTERDVLGPLMRARLLVVSDLAMTTLTDYQREVIYKIVDDRYNNMLPTWVSSNIPDREAFELATSTQIVDRLADGAVYIPCNWKSFRKVAK